MSTKLWRFIVAVLILGLACMAVLSVSAAGVYYVSTAGSDMNPGTQAQPWRTIQKACNTLQPGDTVYVMAGTYNEKVTVNVSGSAAGGYITIQNYGSDKVVVSGAGLAGDDIFYIKDRSYLRIIGLEVCDNLYGSFPKAFFLTGYGSYLEIRNCKIHDIRSSQDAHGIAVYGTSATASINHVVVDGNEIYHCELGTSEGLVLNGNVEFFEVTNNYVHDVNNIGIDFIGGEGKCPDKSLDIARNGVARGNTVCRARSSYGGGWAGGFYIDGGCYITLERNVSYENDLGLEVGCENRGFVATGNIVRDNLIYNNDKVGLIFGGYSGSVGKVRNCLFLNNTCYKNDTMYQGYGEISVQAADNCTVKNNIFYCHGQNVLLSCFFSSRNVYANTINDNTWYGKAGVDAVKLTWLKKTYTGFTAYKAASGNDADSIFGNPLFVNGALPAPDLHLQPGSAAINAGDPSLIPATGKTDIDGQARILGGRVDCGADECQ